MSADLWPEEELGEDRYGDRFSHSSPSSSSPSSFLRSPFLGSDHPPPPWQRIIDRIECLRDDPACRTTVFVHAALLLLILLLASLRKVLVSSSSSSSPSSSSSVVPNAGEEELDGKDEAKRRRKSKARIHALVVYPIKSCSGVQLPQGVVGRKGLELDRRWMIVRRSTREKEKKWEKISLREEPRLTFIQPVIGRDHLSLTLSPLASSDLKPIQIPLEIDESWETLASIEMWGDSADGRIVQRQALHPSSSSSSSGSTLSPSDWLSSYLGYPVLLLQFDPNGPKRNAFPFYRRPDLLDAKGEKMEELKSPRGIEFQDEYPLLVATLESLEALQSQIRDATLASDENTDGRGGPRIGGKLFKAENWRDKVTTNSNSDPGESTAPWLSMLRFRPNIVLAGIEVEVEGLGVKSDDGVQERSIAPWEEDKWTMLEISSSSSSSADPDDKKHPLRLHLSAHCERCLLTTVDPITAERDVSVPLAFLRRSRNHVKKVPLGEDGLPLPRSREKVEEGRKGPCFGVYGVPEIDRESQGEEEEEGKEGKGKLVKVGDEVLCYWRLNDGEGE